MAFIDLVNFEMCKKTRVCVYFLSLCLRLIQTHFHVVHLWSINMYRIPPNCSTPFSETLKYVMS